MKRAELVIYCNTRRPCGLTNKKLSATFNIHGTPNRHNRPSLDPTPGAPPTLSVGTPHISLVIRIQTDNLRFCGWLDGELASRENGKLGEDHHGCPWSDDDTLVNGLDSVSVATHAVFKDRHCLLLISMWGSSISRQTSATSSPVISANDYFEYAKP